MSDETLASNNAVGVWLPDPDAQLLDLSQAQKALQMLDRPLAVVLNGRTPALAVGGQVQPLHVGEGVVTAGALPLLAWLPSFSPAQLGHPTFMRDHKVCWPLVMGAMANAIASTALVEASAQAGMLGFFGAGGLSFDQVEAAVHRLHDRLSDRTWGVNLIHSPQEPALEARVGALLSASRVPVVEASAYLDLTLPLVLLRAKGLRLAPDGSIQVLQKVMGKVSRSEVARKFLSPAPDAMLAELVRRGDLTEAQARVASQVAMCDDLTAEADSGGHTDNRPLVVLFPTLQRLQEEIAAQHPSALRVRLGAGGGIGTPAAMMAAFSLGAAYGVTGSINQCTREAGTSASAKKLLAAAASTDVTMAPAADMFELGVNLQVLSRGTLFPVKARKLYELYRRVPGLDGMSGEERTSLEGILGASVEAVWADCEAFFAPRDPGQLERARRDSKHRLALICRWYLGRASRLAIDGIQGREQDYQIWCGPAMGAFNAWVRGTWLESWERRDVVSCAHALLVGAAAQARQAQLRLQGISWASTLLPPQDEAELNALMGRLNASGSGVGAKRVEGKSGVGLLGASASASRVYSPGSAQGPLTPRASDPAPLGVPGVAGAPLEPVAIVGIGALFPKAPDLKSFWKLLRTGQDAVGEVPATHWSPDDYYDADPKAPDMTYAKRGAFLDPYPFDPTSFGIPPGILEATDTAQLLGLVVARAALADAGYTDQEDWPRARTSVLLGVTGTQELVIPLGARLGHPHWRRALKEAGVDEATQNDVVARIGRAYVGWQESSFPGLLGNVVAGRIANRLNLGGTNSVVDAACASSLAALHLACLELSSGRCDIALSGGVDALNDIFMHMCFSKTPALSPTGDVRPFDVAADGTLLGEGIGILVLRRLSDAKREGQRIYAVLKGIGTSSDGRAKSIYAPLPEGQARALRAAYALAGVSPADIGLVEAHGTGTKAGDVCEVQALKDIYQTAGVPLAHTALGSVKSQIGHTKAAAGVAGLIKAALALHHRVIPPTIKVTRPNPALGIEASPFYLPSEARPWVQSGPGPRRAAVSAFGFGGSNFHAVLEAPEQGNSSPAWDGAISLWAFSGDGWGAIRSQVHSALDQVRAAKHAPWEQRALEKSSRARFDAGASHRLVIACTLAQTLALLQKAGEELERPAPASTSGEGIYYGTGAPSGELALLFPGQGSQYLHMGRELCTVFPELKDRLDSASDIAAYIFPKHTLDEQARRAQNAELTRTEHAQPALAVIEAGMAHILLDRFGLNPTRAAGHSFGELTALYVAQRLTDAELLLLARQRGLLMSSQGRDRGTMLAVSAPLAELSALVAHEGAGLVLANLNTPQQGVLSGPRAAIDHVETLLKARGLSTRRLEVAAAFHSPLVADAEAQLMQVLETLSFPAGTLDVIANSTGLEYPGGASEAKSLLAGQLARPVRFVDVVERLYALGTRTFLEVGPRNVLSSLVRQILGSRPHAAVALDPSAGRSGGLLELARALAQVAVLGHPARLEAWEGDVDRSAPPPRKLTVMLSGANHRDPPKPHLTVPKVSVPNGTVPNGTVPNGTVPEVGGVGVAHHPGPSVQVSVPSAGAPPPRAATVVSQVSGATHERQAPFIGQTEQRNVSREDRHSGPLGFSAASRLNSGTTPRLSEVMMVDPQHKLRTTAPPGEQPMPLFPPVMQGQDNTPLGMVTHHAPGLLLEALRTGQEQLRLLQALQAQTAAVHQRYLEGQDAASRGFMTLVAGQQRMMEHLLLGAGSAGVMHRQAEMPLPTLPGASTGFQGTLQAGQVVPRLHEQGGQEGFPFPVSVLSGAFGPGAGLVQGQASAAGARLSSGLVPAQPPLPAAPRYEGVEISAMPQPVVRPREHGVGASSGPVQSLPSVPSVPSVQSLPSTHGALSGSAQAPKTVTPLPTPSVELSTTLLQVVSELTGYPSSMLGLEMDMESDLGIDSIKRVEILSVLSGRVPGLKAVEPDKLATLRTLQQVLTYLKETRGDSLGKSEARVENGGAHTLPEGAPSPLEPSRPLAATHMPPWLGSLPAEGAGKHDLNSFLISAVATVSTELTSHVVEGSAAPTDAAPTDPAPTDPARTEPDTHIAPDPTLPRLERRLRMPVRLDAPPALTPERRSQTLAGHWLLVTSAPLAAEQSESATGVTGSLGRALRAAGASIEVVSASAVPYASEQTPRGVLLISADAPLPWSEQGEAQLESFFGWTRANARALRQRDAGRPTLFLTLTRQDGMHGLRRVPASSHLGSAEAQPQSFADLSDVIGPGIFDAGLAGLVRTAAQEWPETIACALDVSPDLSDQSAAERVLDELTHLCLEESPIERSGTAVCVELGLDLEGRIGFEWLPDSGEPAAQNPALVPGDVVLITGGARGVTAACALALARACQKRLSPLDCSLITLALVGRSPLPKAEPVWLERAADEASVKRAWLEHGFPGEKPSPRAVGEAAARTLADREIRKNFELLEQTGLKILYYSADIRNQAAVLATVRDLCATQGGITWLIHGAGCLRDRRIEDKTDEQLHEVLSTKVTGLRNLLSTLQGPTLKGLVFFSSVSGRFGRRGQSDYAMANRILDRVALTCSRKGLPACALAWGPWEGGMVNPGLKREFAKEGVGLIPAEAGAEQLVQELARLQAQPGPGLILLGVGLSGFLPSPAVGTNTSGAATGLAAEADIPFSLDLHKQQWLKSHCFGGNAVLPLAKIAEMCVHAVQLRYPGVWVGGLRHLEVLRGIVLEGVTGLHLKVRLSRAGTTQAGMLLLAELRDASEHVRARALVALELGVMSEAPQEPLRTQERSDALKPFGVDSTSDGSLPWYADEWLFHGPHWQVISAVRGLSENRLVVELRPAPGQTQLDESQLLDAVFQAQILWSRAVHQLPCLPSGVEHLQRYPSPDVCDLADPVFLELNIERLEGQVIYAGAQVSTSSRRRLLEVTGVRSTMSRSLIDKFRQTAA